MTSSQQSNTRKYSPLWPAAAVTCLFFVGLALSYNWHSWDWPESGGLGAAIEHGPVDVNKFGSVADWAEAIGVALGICLALVEWNARLDRRVQEEQKQTLRECRLEAARQLDRIATTPPIDQAIDTVNQALDQLRSASGLEEQFELEAEALKGSITEIANRDLNTGGDRQDLEDVVRSVGEFVSKARSTVRELLNESS